MPLNSLTEAINTLTALVQRSRIGRTTGELHNSEMEAIDRLMDETLETIQTLLKVLREAQARGVLEKVVSQDRDVSPDG
jgi:rubrerythrin